MTLALNTGLWAKLRGLFGHSQGTASTDIDVDTDIKRAYEQTLSINADPSATATTNTTLRHFAELKRDLDVIECLYVPDGTLTVNATNYAVVRLLSGNGAAAASTAVASINTAAGSNWAAGTPVTMTLVSAEALLDAGNTLAYDVKKYGAGGVAVPKGGLCIHTRQR